MMNDKEYLAGMSRKFFEYTVEESRVQYFHSQALADFLCFLINGDHRSNLGAKSEVMEVFPDAATAIGRTRPRYVIWRRAIP